MPGGRIEIITGEGVETFCEYSKDGRCAACKILKISCNGEGFWMCEQRRITKENEQQHLNGK